MEKNEIYKIYGTQYKEMTRQILEESDLIGRIPDKSCRIGIKPNLVSPYPPEMGGTTHPEVVSGIIEYLQEHGCRNLILLEGSWVGDRTSEAIKVCRYDQVCSTYGVPFIDMQKEPSRMKRCGKMDLKVCTTIDTVDFLITVPVLKGHGQTRITCALKNLKGLLPNSEKRHFHAMGLHQPIAHLNAGICQDFIVIDHICGDLDFEDGGNPVVRNCIMTALDPVLVDAYVCELLHYDVSEVPYIKMAEALGVGSADLSALHLQISPHSDPAEIREELPYARKVIELIDAVEEVESCSACYGYLLPALWKLKEENRLEELQEKICIGQGYRGKTGQLGVGSCTKGFVCSIPGCPPTEQEIYEGLVQYLDSQPDHGSCK